MLWWGSSTSRVLYPTEDMSGWGQGDPDGPNSNQCCFVLSVITKGRQTNTHKCSHTRTDRMAMAWSMNPWAGLKRRHILEACRSSLMSNLPHQKTFIPINKVFDKGALHRLSIVPTSHDCVHSAGDMLVWVHCACQKKRFSFEAGKGRCHYTFIVDFYLCILDVSLQVCMPFKDGLPFASFVQEEACEWIKSAPLLCL